MAKFFFPEDMIPGRAVDEDKNVVFDPAVDSACKNYETVTRKWLRNALEEAEFDTKKDEDVKNAQYYIQYLLGKQWPSRRASYRSNAVDNQTLRLMWELVALLTDLRPVGQVKSTWPNEFLESEQMLNSATKAWWLESDADLKLALCIVYSILGTGFVKLRWNQELRMGQGDFELVPIGPMNCLCLKPTDTDLQSSQAVIHDEVWPLWKFRQKFGARSSQVKPHPDLSRYTVPAQAPEVMSPAMYAALPPQLKRLSGGRPESKRDMAFPMGRYREFWFRDMTLNPSNKKVQVGPAKTTYSYWVNPGEPLYPRGRLICMGNDDVILWDGPNPYWHGQWPYDVLRLNIVPWNFFGLSELRGMIPLNDAINNILAGIIDLVKKAVNPQLIGPRNAFSEAQWAAIDTAKPGAKLATNPLSSTLPQWQAPPNLPAWVMTTLMFLVREIQQQSGVAAVAQAVQKRQVPSGETLEEIKEVQQTPLRLKGRNIEVLLRNLGTMNISNVYQFLPEERRMFLSGKPKAGMPELEHFDWIRTQAIPRLKGQTSTSFKDELEYARQFVYRIHPGSLLNINHVEKTMTIMRLRMMKDIDRKTMFEVLDLGLNINDVETNLREEAMQQAKVLAAQRMVLMLQQALPALAGPLGKLLQGQAGEQAA